SMTQMVGGDGFPTRKNTDGGGAVPIPVTNPSSTPNGANGRIVLATPTLANEPLLDTNYQGWLYALVVGTNNAILNLYLTKDFGHNWSQLLIPFFTAPLGGTFPTNNELATSPYNPLGSQGNYDVSMTIDPTNPNVVYIGGQNDVAPSPTGGLIRVDVTK